MQFKPFIDRKQEVARIKNLFLKDPPIHQNENCVFLPKDILV